MGCYIAILIKVFKYSVAKSFFYNFYKNMESIQSINALKVCLTRCQIFIVKR